MTNKFLFCSILGAIVVLNVLSREYLIYCYLMVADFLDVVPWVKNHTVQISDFGHIIVAFGLTLFLFISSDIRKSYLFTFLILFILGCEFLQLFTPTRKTRVIDVAAGLSGISFAAVIYFSHHLLKKRIEK